jgi:inositol-phosphate transport system permease protein
MATDTLVKTVSNPPQTRLPTFALMIWRGLRLALTISIALALGAAALEWLLRPALQSVSIEENFTATLSALLVGLLPISFYIAGGIAARGGRKTGWMSALIAAWIVAAVGYGLLTAYQVSTQSGIFRQATSLGFTLQQTDAGVEVVSVDAGGPAEVAGVQPGDIITALRRDPVTADDLQFRISQAAVDDAFRLRIQRGGEELQLTTRIGVVNQTDLSAWGRGLIAALVITAIALVIPAQWMPHVLVIFAMLPLVAGYLWLIIATFSQRTHGLLPVDINGDIGGWTLANWDFLAGRSAAGSTVNILAVTLNSLIIALTMTVVSLVICSMSGYALSRMTFPGRRLFLSMTLVLHGFPAVTLIIPIFFILINLGNIPIIGKLIGYNSTGGIALVMIAFELPLGVWLMKGFFDNISWDMERSALIDGASRWRTFWEIILPQIRPGLLALGIFSFIGGWNAYLIPATYSVGTGLATLPVYIRQLSGELAPVNWNQVAAVGLFQLIPIFIFFIFAQEYLLNIYAGGTKGSS